MLAFDALRLMVFGCVLIMENTCALERNFWTYNWNNIDMRVDSAFSSLRAQIPTPGRIKKFISILKDCATRIISIFSSMVFAFRLKQLFCDGKQFLLEHNLGLIWVIRTHLHQDFNCGGTNTDGDTEKHAKVYTTKSLIQDMLLEIADTIWILKSRRDNCSCISSVRKPFFKYIHNVISVYPTKPRKILNDAQCGGSCAYILLLR